MNSGMFKSSVKTTTPAKPSMQNLCLTVFWLVTLAFSFGSHAQAQPSPADIMGQQVRQWLSQTHSVAAKDVVIAPLDERLKVQSCSKPLLVDHPFASKETVRVRCAEPIWQLYLQVSMTSALPKTAANSAADNAKGATRTVVVAKRLLQRGTILQPDMLEEAQASANQVDTQLLTSLKDAQQAELTRDISAGQPLRGSDLRRAVLVKQGQVVMLSIGEKADFQISVRMEAMQDGRLGEQVKLKNPESGKQVSGIVTGPNTAKGL
jgi:flagella basal body P-ring formation protein FlgA